MPKPWPIVFMGTPQIAAATLAELVRGPDRVVGVVTQPDRPVGRGRQSAPSSVRQFAETCGLPVVAPEKIRAPDFLDTLRGWRPEILIIVAYGRILPKAILELAPHGCLNVHYSLLPKYRGAAPAAWTIINGETEGGVTTMKLVEKMDAGAIYLQESIALASDETAGSLQAKLTPLGSRLLRETLLKLKDGSLIPREQDEDLATLAPILRKDDGIIDWRRSAQDIERRVRGFDPWPGNHTFLNGKLLKVHRVKIVLLETKASPGEILRADGSGLWVASGSGVLALEEIQLENKKRLPAVEFVKGARIKAGDCLGSGT